MTHDQPIPAATLAAEYHKQLARQTELCNRLEAVADSLPDSCNVQECLYLAQSFTPIVKQAHRFEEDQVFALLRAQEPPTDLASTLERLAREHMEDEEVADEVTLALRDYVAGHKNVKAETLAWMLHASFEAMRRHLAFERDYMLPLVEKHHGH